MDNYWYARDKDGQLFAYREEPHKLSESWSNDEFDCEWYKVVPDIGYNYIRWDDKRATHGAFVKMQSQIESTLCSKVIAINGEFEYIKELHNLSS